MLLSELVQITWRRDAARERAGLKREDLHEEPFDVEYAVCFTPGEDRDAAEGKADTKPGQQGDVAKGFDHIGLHVCDNGVVEGEEKGAGENCDDDSEPL